MTIDNENNLKPQSEKEWYDWLSLNYKKKKFVNLVIPENTSITYKNAIEIALNFGWVDIEYTNLDNHAQLYRFVNIKFNKRFIKIFKKRLETYSYPDIVIKKLNVYNTKTTEENIKLPLENVNIPKELLVEFEKYPESLKYFSTLDSNTQNDIIKWISNSTNKNLIKKRVFDCIYNFSEKKLPKTFLKPINRKR
jgi:uncharacterized protein YdeI (YjbR/CyaY-like superfamily)